MIYFNDKNPIMTFAMKYQETRFLEEELKRRESLIKQEISSEGQEMICVDKNTIKVENLNREEQIRMHFEMELEKKVKSWKRKK